MDVIFFWHLWKECWWLHNTNSEVAKRWKRTCPVACSSLWRMFVLIILLFEDFDQKSPVSFGSVLTVWALPFPSICLHLDQTKKKKKIVEITDCYLRNSVKWALAPWRVKGSQSPTLITDVWQEFQRVLSDVAALGQILWEVPESASSSSQNTTCTLSNACFCWLVG